MNFIAAKRYIAERYGDAKTGVLHPAGNDPVADCHCKNCDRRWVDVVLSTEKAPAQ